MEALTVGGGPHGAETADHTMTFYERLDAAADLLRRRGRVSYRALKREFDLDDAFLEDLRAELVDVQRVARDEGGTLLVWIGDERPAAAPTPDDPVPAPPAPASGGEAERRHVTVMFCDLVGSVALASRLDPEDLGQLLEAYGNAVDEVVRRFGGVIARRVGDSLLIYFGYPHAHEDDAERAVRAGLRIVGALRDLYARLGPALAALRDIPLQVRIGLHTGLAVMGAMGDGAHRDDMAAVGETPNLAARVQGLAEPDAVLFTEATHRLLRGRLVCVPLGSRSLKGITAPVQVYRALREPEVADGGEEAIAPLSPLIGREREVGLLLDRWAQVVEGLGQVVLLSGEAGIGKSHLVHVLKARTVHTPRRLLEARGSSHHQQSAFHPVTELLQRALGFERCPAAEERLARLEDLVSRVGVSPADTVPFLAPLLALPLPEVRYPPLLLSRERRRQRTLETVVALILELAARQPVLLIVEDLHWVDPSTLECLGLLVGQAPTTRLLALFTARPEFRAPWASRAHMTPLTLGRLRRAQIEALIGAVAGGKALPPAVVEQVATKTDGVPLFVEELTKMVLESGLLREDAGHYHLVGPLPPLAIPATLQDSLMARLDRLATVKVVAQIGATIGRTFSYGLLRAVAGLPDPALQRELGDLVEAELLYQRGAPPEATYTFKHALIQEAAYQTLLRSTQQQYHERVARALEAQFPQIVETQPEILAQHYTQAGLGGPASAYWQRAGQRAAERSASAEAISHVTKGLESLADVPDSRERAQRELSLQLMLGPALMAMKGQAAPEVGQAYARARELCRQVEDPAQLFRVLRGLWNVYVVRAELSTAREVAEQLLALAERMDDAGLRVAAHRSLGVTLFYLGELEGARAHLERGLVLYGPIQRGIDAVLYGEDPGVGCGSFLAWTLWLLGDVDQAWQRAEAAVVRARGLSHVPSLAFALNYAARLHQHRRERQATQDVVDELIALSEAHGFAQRLATGRIQRGWARAEGGDLAGGLAEMRESLAAYQATGGEVARPFFLGVLAETYGKAGRPDEGLAAVAEALALAQTHGERWWEAELLRLRGRLLLAQGIDSPAAAEAEASLVEALDRARGQRAKSLELRAAMSLSRLWQDRGKRDQARDLLAAIHGRFTEGFDTADLQEARGLLRELS
jgi:class 3 adenylate cyclase/predicted ATPase